MRLDIPAAWRALMGGALAFLCTALAGCAVYTRPYVEPASGPTASLRIVNATPGGSSAFFYEDAKECSRRSNSGLISPNTERVFRVAADKELALTVGYDVQKANPRIICNVTASFVPAAGQVYQATLVATTSGEFCAVKIERVAADGRTTEAVASHRREPRDGFDENSSFCKPR